MAQKFHLECNKCGHIINDFQEWFKVKQHCPKCGCPEATVVYAKGFKDFHKFVSDKNFDPKSLWGYFDYLPLNDKNNIVSAGGEGICPIEQWDFLAKFAKEKYNINIKVYAHRHDRNHATGTFKDLAGTVAASVLKENGIKSFVAASTGNIGVAYSRYLAAANIPLYLFIPEISLKSQEAEIGTFGQSVIRTEGDYAFAKKMAKDFATKHDFVLTAGNFCPMRIEAKKTMVYEWLRLLPDFPTVFMQAISGGSGPIGIYKSCKELEDEGLFNGMPRFILPQPHRCAPMAEAWDNAKAKDFPEGWENEYPVYDNPETTINTLATGNPTAFPSLAKMVRESNGEITSVDEDKTIDISRLVAYETTWRIGPAAAVTTVGFFTALKNKQIKDGDVVMLNIGEGTARSPKYVEKLAYSTSYAKTVDDVQLIDRNDYAKKLWQAVEEI